MDRLLRIRDVSAITALSRSTIYRRLDDKTFPEPVKVSRVAIRWKESALNDWMSRLIESKAAAWASDEGVGLKGQAALLLYSILLRSNGCFKLRSEWTVPLIASK